MDDVKRIRSAMAGAAIAILASGGCGRATLGLSVTPRVLARGAADLGIPPCDPAAAADPLSDAALECWFTAAHGRWRTISHEDHYTELVVHVRTADLDDAREIAQAFVAGEGDRFTEISVYAQKEGSRAESPTRRVSWTRDGGFALMDFRGAAAR